MEEQMKDNYSSPALVRGMEQIYGGENTKVFKIQMQHEEEIKKYLKITEDAHKKAAKSKLRFGQ